MKKYKYPLFIVLIMGTAFSILFSGFTLSTEVALIIFSLAIASDFYTTWACLKSGGREGNPIIAFLLKRMGILKAFGLLAALWVCFIVFRWLHSASEIQTAMAFAYWLVPVNNLTVLRRLRRKAA